MWPFFQIPRSLIVKCAIFIHQNNGLSIHKNKYTLTIGPGNKKQQRLCDVRTGLVDFVAQREARPLVGIVRHKLDVDGRP